MTYVYTYVAWLLQNTNPCVRMIHIVVQYVCTYKAYVFFVACMYTVVCV